MLSRVEESIQRNAEQRLRGTRTQNRTCAIERRQNTESRNRVKQALAKHAGFFCTDKVQTTKCHHKGSVGPHHEQLPFKVNMETFNGNGKEQAQGKGEGQEGGRAGEGKGKGGMAGKRKGEREGEGKGGRAGRGKGGRAGKGYLRVPAAQLLLQPPHPSLQLTDTDHARILSTAPDHNASLTRQPRSPWQQTVGWPQGKSQATAMAPCSRSVAEEAASAVQSTVGNTW